MTDVNYLWYNSDSLAQTVNVNITNVLTIDVNVS